ncbi:hypothetical protein CPC16_003988 [Podila verticillata]|nr:hypothetical protein BGZ59_000174 [Podila verticillata]KAF9370065.1 hypothetical protein CPC16_003988 [Podila verticillata]KAI9242372.1 MAG: NADPH-dependent FMN reductase [Podila humilis]
MPLLNIALVTCSTRNPRVNPFITSYVHSILAAIAPDHITLQILDIAEQSLPLYDEPAIPSQLPATDPTPYYQQEHTRQWSAKVRAYDAFVFVTPQYNWSVPASLKNALDYLFYEWKGKPAAIVSYGGHGGNKAADHLRGILGGLRMKAAATAPALTIPSSILGDSLEQGRIPDEQIKVWQESGAEEAIRQMFRELIHLDA